LSTAAIQAALFDQPPAETTPGPVPGLPELFRGDALDAYPDWPAPATIISDGAYGVRGFRGDTTGPDGLPDWYRPHIEAWSAAAGPATTLWFWNTEVGWASVHPLLTGHGWDYVQLITPGTRARPTSPGT
jgi:hypothetical protein